MNIAVIAGENPSPFCTALSAQFDYFVGVDRGALFLLQQSLPLNMAVGDFDSVSAVEFEGVLQQAEKLVQAPEEKNDTDLELAISAIFHCYPQAKVQIFGALGGRLDHQMSNLFLVANPEIAPFMSQIELIDSQNHILFRPAGKHLLSPISQMHYIGFMPMQDGALTIRYAKYPLNENNYFIKPCYGSNEFIKDTIEIELESGYVLVIYSKDR
ncbi:thiamine diphosphokinase [Rodentibacter haemolyticus]|uniref:Thiamine diphosphokinase n=1 Tax=Rodentibacter haemolyticus TaxID=2778911 RepID=A0ABX6UWJ6_9PAST|nr:thiamine diphosphokinase [Rodentibacter haemolyticus]QPB42298.1 thiamine diphosphokinase [Rodentibacter haemolyticus]